MSSVNSKSTQFLLEQPSCVAFCQTSTDHLIIGTYQLVEADASQDGPTQKRSGSIALFHLQNNNLHEVVTLPSQSGVLDLELSPHDPTLVCAASSTGSLMFYRFEESSVPSAGSTTTLSHITTTQIFDTNILILDLAFHNTNQALIATTQSNGTVTLLQLSPTYELQITQILHTFPLEAWTCIFSSESSHLLAGSDDSTLAMIPLSHAKPPIDHADHPTELDLQQSTNTQILRKLHNAGVTSVIELDTPKPPSLSETDTLLKDDEKQMVPPLYLLTGSYDDRIRVLQVHPAPSTSRPNVVAEKNLDGGVWRLKRITSPTNTDAGVISSDGKKTCTTTLKWVVLASCMHAGSRIVQISCARDSNAECSSCISQWDINVMARFEEHESMNYGSDVQSSSKACERVVVSTSFYDKRVCVWDVDMSRYSI